jgi:COP9 signalosome complex subunit 5
MSAGKVELGCFRTFTNEIAEKRQNKQGGMAAIPEDKIDDFGLHGHKYYQLDHSFFKSDLDTEVIDRMWNEYWVHTLASSPLITNENFTAASIIQIVKKMNEISAGTFGQAAGGKQKKGGRGGGNFGMGGGSKDKLELEKYNPIEKESSKVAVGMTTGVLMEFLKKFMFAY